MTKFAVIAALPLLAGFALAQDQQTQTQTQTRTTTTTTQSGARGDNTWNGTLVDQGCYTQRVHKTESNSDGNTTTQTESTKVTTACPVSNQTTSFGMITSDGKYVHFDDAGNAKIMQMMKSDKDWDNNLQNHKPMEVRVVGTANGDVVVIKQIK